MKKLLTICVLSIFFTACNSETSTVKAPPLSPSEKINPIAIPFFEQGYSEHSSKVITSQKSLDTFLTQISNEENWNKKTIFLEKLQDIVFDFKTHNLLFYRMTEGSTSIKVVVLNNEISISENNINIPIKRTVPEVGDTAMAYYALAYKVAKEVKSITFNNPKQKVVVDNKESNMVIPQNCESWFDGCNDCKKINIYKDIACTEKSCLVYRPQDFRCTSWK